jgi:hypothetical protein
MSLRDITPHALDALTSRSGASWLLQRMHAVRMGLIENGDQKVVYVPWTLSVSLRNHSSHEPPKPVDVSSSNAPFSYSLGLYANMARSINAVCDPLAIASRNIGQGRRTEDDRVLEPHKDSTNMVESKRVLGRVKKIHDAFCSRIVGRGDEEGTAERRGDGEVRF